MSSSGGVPSEGFALTGQRVTGERCEPDPEARRPERVVLCVVVKVSLHRTRRTQQNPIMLLGRPGSPVA